MAEGAGVFTAPVLDLEYLDLKRMEQCPAGWWPPVNWHLAVEEDTY